MLGVAQNTRCVELAASQREVESTRKMITARTEEIKNLQSAVTETLAEQIAEGEKVVMYYGAANRDPAAFPEPDQFDIARENRTGVLTFGSGAHYCLGSHLARLELTQALTVMARLMPNLRRTGPSPWPSMLGIAGPSILPVAFG